MNDYPKVLIIGQNFDKSGGGITLANLFLGWPEHKIAVASMEIDTNDKFICNNFYMLGYLETKRQWPFSLIQRKYFSGRINLKDKQFTESLISKTKENSFRRFVRLKYKEAQHYLGMYHYIHSMSTSDSFIKWIKDFKPDLIYTQLSSLGIIRLVKKVCEITNKPVAIHIMDDWPTTIVKPGLYSGYWKEKIDSSFRELLNYSNVNMAICKAMADEYEQRYKKTFLYFHNPVDLILWKDYIRTEWTFGDEFRVLYAGRLGKITLRPLLDICQVLDEIKIHNSKIVFEILTSDKFMHDLRLLKKYKFVEIKPYVKHNQMPQKLKNVDLLIIPLGFDQQNIKFTRFSMPTKVSEYMASGTPILIYAPPETALVKYAKEENWGSVVDTQDKEVLKKTILRLITDVDFRGKLGKTATTLAFQKHNAEIVRKEFQSALIKSCAIDI